MTFTALYRVPLVASRLADRAWTAVRPVSSEKLVLDGEAARSADECAVAAGTAERLITSIQRARLAARADRADISYTSLHDKSRDARP